MPYYETSQEWLRQSAMLLEARGSSTRITTTYHLTDKSGTSKKRQKRRQEQREAANPTTAPTSAAPRASLTIKTYDPHTGTCLKYRTTKAAEVSRLILCLGQLGRKMAALPSSTDADVDAVMADAAGAGVDDVGGTPAAAEKTEGAGAGAAKGQAQGQQQQQQQQQGGGGKNKKKKGKK